MKIENLLASALPTVPGTKVKTGKRGRPVTSDLSAYANNREKPLPDTLAPLTDNVRLIAGFLDALSSARRELTEAEAEAIAEGRDASAMDLLNGEPVQSDVFLSFPVVRNDDETLGDAFRREVREALDIAQFLATKRRRDISVYVTRYATERNLRDAATAKKYEMPQSAVGLMSRNIVGLIITDYPKAFKGEVARCGIRVPEPRRTASEAKERAFV